MINFLEQGYSYNFELYFIKGGNGTPIRMCAKEKNSSEEYIFEKSKWNSKFNVKSMEFVNSDVNQR